MSELKIKFPGPASAADGVDFGIDGRTVRVSQEAYSIFLAREAAAREKIAALQQRLNAADQRIDEVERDKVRIDWLAEQPVDTLYLDDGRIIDIAGRVDLRDAIDAAMAAPRPADGGGDEN